MWKHTSATAPAHGEGTIVAATVDAAVGSVRVLACIRSKDSSKLLVAREGKSAVVLEEDSAVGSHLADCLGVIVADVNVVINAGVIFLGIRMEEAFSVLRPRREVGAIFKLVGVTVDVVPGGNNAGCHVIEAEVWDGAVENGHGEVGSLFKS